MINMGKKVSVTSEKYSVAIGLWKSLKNSVIILGGAAGIQLLEARAQWIPPGFEWLEIIIGAVVAYMIKNGIEFKMKK